MTNNDDQVPDDFNDDGLDGDAGFDDLQSGNSLGDMWRNNPLVKIGVVFAGFALIVGGVILFGGKEEAPPASEMTAGSEVKQIPGQGEVTPVYEQAVKEQNTQELEKAMKEGGSAMPIPITPVVERLPLPAVQEEQEDPLERWRRIQEERQKRESQRAPELPQTDPNSQVIDDLAEAMSQQMQTILQTMSPSAIKTKNVSQPDYMKKLREQEQAKAAQAAAAAAAGVGTDPIKIILPAGTVEYAQLITEANSDVPGPILAQIVSGPLAGSRMLGSFTKQDEEYLVLTFDTVVIDGISYDISAIALDPANANPGMVTDVDHKYFQRIILPAAAAFVTGVGAAIAETESTTTATSDVVSVDTEEPDLKEELFKGVELASAKVGEIIDEESDVEPMVKVRAGTPMGVLFIEAIFDDPQNAPGEEEEEEQSLLPQGFSVPSGPGIFLPIQTQGQPAEEPN